MLETISKFLTDILIFIKLFICLLFSDDSFFPIHLENMNKDGQCRQ